MTKYVLLYKAHEPMNWSEYPKEEVTKLIQAWNDWDAKLGAAHVGGGPFKFGGKSATTGGVKDADNCFTGFAIVEAESMESAIEYALQAPMVLRDTGTLEVYELMSI
ncbi:MAG TPA: YciI family protein [Candidatus Saccharimonadia bacterium]|nr:YciI family protein [Candidatus Saccharimonadia bacterium]